MRKAKLLVRERINTALSALYDYPLTILEAPMGFGKTTAVRSFLTEEKLYPIWITYRKLSDPMTIFWNGLVEEIVKLDDQIGQALRSLGFPVDTPQLDKFLLLMNKIKFTHEIALVMDDYQYVQDMQLNRLILLLAEEELDGLHLLLITRDTSNINFVELYSKGLCHIITRQQLRFNDSEIRAYCEMISGNISEQDLKKICEYTEGWVSFIYIILIGLKNGVPVGLSTTAEDLIETALFNNYDPQVQDFLLMLSVMEDFSAVQAEYVTHNAETKAMLRKLSKENAFIYYDEANKKYKIHNILLDYLRQKQSFPDDALKELYRRLGEWYLELKDFMPAYSYLYKAGRIEQILQCLNTPSNIRDDLTSFEGSEEMFEHTPQELLFQYPFAYLQYLFLSLVKEDISQVLRWKECLEALEQHYKKMTGIEEGYRNRIISEILIIKKFTSFNHLEEMKASNKEILELMDGQNSYIAIQENAFTFGSPHYLYLYFREIGSFQRIADLLSEEVGYAKFSNGCGTGCDSLARAEYALETGNFEHVERYCTQTRIKAGLKKQNSVDICARFTLIRHRILEGKAAEAEAMLNELDQDASGMNDPILNTTVDLCKGYLFACLDQPDKIPVWLQIGEMTAANLMYEGVAFNYLVFGKAMIALKRYEALEVFADQHFHEYFAVYHNQLGFIHNGIFKAVAKSKLYGLATGIPILEAVLKEAQQDHIVMPFIEAAPYITEMLQKISKASADDEYIQFILTNCRSYCNNIKNNINEGDTTSVPLTNRELEIITLLDQGLSRKQIAEKLYISMETAKTHMKNIYQKLEVNGKVSAINAARNKGYLS